jgi:hypothetical protein
VDALTAKRGKTSGAAKGKLTRDINKLLEEMEALRG